MSAQEVAIMRALTRHFLAHGILLPFGAAACLSTPMTAAEMDRVVAVFDDFLAQCEPSDGDKQ
ncbi:hypothetical protein [Mesorhizobium sp. M8A.F.Ca.ET.167.01.1.1]|nr:hypothetical protein [Mesorhizobium sp. M8A.F.Ca.ET.167.01.1.1]TGT43221.1 hypothetical protein EN810_34680 [Mesorhizobium sp. M8A.F.Ca.ET.167.01.1.1]